MTTNDTLTIGDLNKQISDDISAASDYCTKNHNGTDKDCGFCRFDNAILDAINEANHDN